MLTVNPGLAGVVAFDDMHGRSVAGSASEWHQISIVLDVAKSGPWLRLGGDCEAGHQQRDG